MRKEEIIFEEFGNLSERQKEQIRMLGPLYEEWNSKINVISRKDIEELYLHHVLHSLSIAKVVEFPSGAEILDVGTGGGFPGIPLAILFPEVNFTLVDSVGKKTKVAAAVAQALGLENVTVLNCRVEDMGREKKFTYIVSRAVTDLSNFLPWVKGRYTHGIFYLKGGDLKRGGMLYNEIETAIKKVGIQKEKLTGFNIEDIFHYDFFEGKKIIFFAN